MAWSPSYRMESHGARGGPEWRNLSGQNRVKTELCKSLVIVSPWFTCPRKRVSYQAIISCGSSCTTSAECKTIRIAVSPVMDMPGDFTQGVDFIKMLEWFGRFGVDVFWLMAGKWTGCPLVVSKKIDYLCINLLNCALQSTCYIYCQYCFLQNSHKAILIKPCMNIICIHFPTTCWVL